MSWLFSQALVEEYSADTFLDGEPCAQLNVMPTAQQFWHKGKMMDCSQLSRFGQTSRLLTGDLGDAVLTSFLAAFPAKTSALLVKGQESTEIVVGSGYKVRGLLAKWSPHESCWRIAQCSLLGDSDVFSETWPQWGLMRAGECWELDPPVFPIFETVSGSLLPTPSGVNGGTNNTMGRIDEWGGSSNPLRGTVIGSMCLPEFEELVMGWPVTWTAPMPFAMDKFHAWLSEHGKP